MKRTTKGPSSSSSFPHQQHRHHHSHAGKQHLEGTLPSILSSSSSSSSGSNSCRRWAVDALILGSIVLFIGWIQPKLEHPEAIDCRSLNLASIIKQPYKAEVSVATISISERAAPPTEASTTTAASSTFTSDNDNTLLHEEEGFFSVGQLLVTAPTDGNNSAAFQDMEKLCTLQRYTYLLGKFCDPVDRLSGSSSSSSSSCDLQAFDAYFANHRARDQLVAGCPLNEAICYAKRYTELYQGYCNNNGGNSSDLCNFYALREHFEQHGRKQRLVWGCDVAPLQPNAVPVSTHQPAVTVDKLPVAKNIHQQNVLGKASLQVFQGSWEPVEYNQENVPSETICPKLSTYRFCNLNDRDDYEPAQYRAIGLPEWSAKRFTESMAKDGGRILFVGDSLMRQLYQELNCHAESENVTLHNTNFRFATMATHPEWVHEQYEVRGLDDQKKKEAFLLSSWVDHAIEADYKYVVYSTGAWWNPYRYRKRGE
jgi:GDSL/SGNH-like Acyl-Esterase family found in Pmr5 and Cas1p